MLHRIFISRGIALSACVLALLPSAALAVPLPGQPAPAFSLPAPAGKPVSLAALRGRPIYLNFFASWCGPCNEEAPSIGKLRSKYAKQGLVVFGVDELEAGSQGATFQAKYHAPFTLVGVDESGEVGKTYGTIVMPVHVFINRRGIVTAYHLGEMDPAEIDAAITGSLK